MIMHLWCIHLFFNSSVVSREAVFFCLYGSFKKKKLIKCDEAPYSTVNLNYLLIEFTQQLQYIDIYFNRDVK